MSIVAAISNAQTPEVIPQIQLLVTVSLVVSLSIALLSSDSKYWNRWASSTLEVCSSPLLITFAGILVYKVMLIT
jgi:hypothetical protein